MSARKNLHGSLFSYFDPVMFERRSDTLLLTVEPDRGVVFPSLYSSCHIIDYIDNFNMPRVTLRDWGRWVLKISVRLTLDIELDLSHVISHSILQLSL